MFNYHPHVHGIITQEFADMLLTWNHNSGFNVHAGGYINREDTSIEKVTKYISRAPISVDRVEYNPDDNTVIVHEKQDKSDSCKSEAYSILEWRIWPGQTH